MNVKVWIEIQGQVDSIVLWNAIGGFEMNLTEVIEKTWVYGKCSYTDAGRLISICSLFGNLRANIIREGEEDEQEE